MTLDVRRVRTALLARPHKPATLRGDERFAAVAAVLRDRDGAAEVLLIRRAEHVGDPWSGHMAFPGGRQDPTDADLVHTAVRETEEEVGLRLDRDGELVGRLDDLPVNPLGKHLGLVIAPFVFAIEGDPELVLNTAEVTEFIWAPLEPLARGERNTHIEWKYGNQPLLLPGYDVEGRIVWGLTHRMLGALFAVLDVEGPRG